MKTIINLFLTIVLLLFGNLVFAENNSSSGSNAVKIKDSYGKIVHEYFLEKNLDESINLIFDGNKQTLKEIPQFFFLENGKYFINYLDIDNIYKINYNGTIIVKSNDKYKLNKVFDGEENLFSKNHFISTSQKNDKNVIFKKNYFVDDNGEIISTIEESTNNKETFTEEIVYGLSKIKIGDDFIYSSYYSVGKLPATYIFYKGKIIKFYNKLEIANDGKNYIFLANDESNDTVIYLNLNLIYKGNKDGAVKLFNEKYGNYKEIDKKFIENVTLDEYKKFVKNNLQYVDNIFLLLNENISSENNEIKEQKIKDQLINDKKTKSQYLKQLILSKNNLKEAKQEKYILEIDNFVEKTDNKKLEKFLEKILKLKNKNDITVYLEAKIYFKIKKNSNIDSSNNQTFLTTEAQEFDKTNNINRIYGDEKNNTLKGVINKRNIIWGKQGKDSLYGGKLDDIIIVVGDMSKYGKTDTKQTLEFLGFQIQEINGKNFNISGSPKIIDGGEGKDILFITGDIDLSKTDIVGIEDVVIH